MNFRRKKPHKSNRKLTRKQQRKEKRLEKKVRRNEYYTNRRNPDQFLLNPNGGSANQSNINQIEEKAENKGKVLTTEQLRQKEKKEQKKIEKQMMQQRNKQLLEANIEEDRNIKRLEKQLKLNKRKSKSIPKAFLEDGLDYLLEICDSETRNQVTAEQELNEINNEFEEDFALMTDKVTGVDNILDDYLNASDNDDYDDDSYDANDDKLDSELEMQDNDYEHILENYDNTNSSSDGKSEINKRHNMKSKKTFAIAKADKNIVKLKRSNQLNDILENLEEGICPSQKGNTEEKLQKTKKRKNCNNMLEAKELYEDCTQNKRNKLSSEEKTSEMDTDNETEGIVKNNADGTWEDIYGKLRTRDGNIIKNEKYIPPAIRAKLATSVPENKKRLEKLSRLKKQLQGLLNRLAESNMYNIAMQIEKLYMNNSRNDMNETLTNLMTESLISEIITPERLLMEHVVLITILHANVGTEVGAHFLQFIIKKFDEYIKRNHNVENKQLDNIINIISQLYNFKLFDAKLLYEILQKLSNTFREKDVECILNILKSVGFTLRKDDPVALKNLILGLQNQAVKSSEQVKDNPRIKFMLDILLAIKNNNITKIPNYDTSYSEHLKKIMKGFIRKGNYVTQLNICLEDLLKAEEKGKWWVVGSAWTGNAPKHNEALKDSKISDRFSEQLLELARKQRMNTDTRRNIFCIIVSAEDYLDAFEKLLKLGLRHQQEREIINIILHCCLQEKVYNPYYAVLAQKFCEYDRKFQMTIKCSIWDKLKSLSDHSGSQISNLAKMLTHLFLEKGLPISTLKIVQFSELDKVTLRFMRQILLGILLHKDEDACLAVFEKVAHSDKLKLLRESLRLFIHHFLLRNLISDQEDTLEHQKCLLETRAKIVEKMLISKESRIKF